MHVKRHTVSITTDSSGDATVYTDVIDYGEIKQIRYAKTDFADGVDFVVSLENTGVIVWDEDDVNTSGTRCPQQATHLNTTGAAALYAGGGSAVLRPVVVAGERIKVVVAAGGDTKTGTVYIWIGG